jgi:hypothetical protein
MIDYISLGDISNKNILRNQIYPDLSKDYYWSDDFTTKFYIELAKAGFITIGLEYQESQLLLPQIQFHYALLEHKDLHISRHIQKLLHKDCFSFSVNQRFHEVVAKIKEFHLDCWIHAKYERLLYGLHENRFEDFELISSELTDPKTNECICGEIGYLCNGIYTGLTKFSSRKKCYSGWGNLQRVLLTKYLDSVGIALSNLGHPYMQYKIDLGAIIYPRRLFLEKCKMV